MKKLSLLFVFIFSFSSFVSAAPVGNPSGPVLLDGKYPTKFSLEAETVIDRELKTAASSGKKVKFYSLFYTGKISLFVNNKVDAYVLIGTQESNVRNFVNEHYIINGKTDIAYGAGVSYIIYTTEIWNGIGRIGADVKYRQFQPDIDDLKYYHETIPVNDDKMIFREWQASLGFSYQYKKFVPYAGIKYSDLHARIKFRQDNNLISETDIRSDNIIGLFAGLDVILNDFITLNMEVREFDEEALNLGMSIRF